VSGVTIFHLTSVLKVVSKTRKFVFSQVILFRALTAGNFISFYTIATLMVSNSLLSKKGCVALMQTLQTRNPISL